MESLPWISTDSVNIDRYFTKVELENLCDFEKLRLKNMKRNYETMQLLGQYSADKLFSISIYSCDQPKLQTIF